MLQKSNTWGPRRRPLPDYSYKRSDTTKTVFSESPWKESTEILDPWSPSTSADPSRPLLTSTEDHTPSPDIPRNSDTIHLAVSLYSFQGNSQYYELSFEQMDAILIVNTEGDDGWWEAYTLGPIADLHGISSWDSSAADIAPEVWCRLRDDDPLRVEAQSILESWKVDNWEAVEGLEFGFVPAAYTAILASISRDEISRTTTPLPVEPPAYQLLQHAEYQSPRVTSRVPISLDYLPHRLLHRFNPFVTSGAEEFILTNCEEVPQDVSTALSCLNAVYRRSVHLESTSISDLEINLPPPVTRPLDAQDSTLPSDVHVITSGPSWQRTPWSLHYREVQISDPQHKNSWAGFYEWIVYKVTSVEKENSSLVSDTTSEPISVSRRFSHFKVLHQYLTRKFPVLIVPELPESPYSGRFRDQFVKKRMRALERWINRITRHPVLGSSEGVQVFLASGAFRVTQSDNKEEEEGKTFEASLYKIISEDDVIGARFFLNVYHPEFNITPETVDDHDGSQFVQDLTGDSQTLFAMSEFLNNSTKKIKHLHFTLEKYKSDSLLVMLKDLKSVSKSWLTLGKNRNPPQPMPVPSEGQRDTESFVSEQSSSTTNYLKHIWCHKQTPCEECGRLTDGIQAIAATLSAISKSESEYVHSNLTPLMEHIEEWSNLESKLGYIIQVHNEASRIGKHLLSQVHEEIPGVPPVVAPSHIAARLQTVFNVIHAEIDHWFHRDRLFEWSHIISETVDMELERLQRSTMLLQGCKSIVMRAIRDEGSYSPQEEVEEE